MASSWGPKLEKKLKALADGASKESMQTLATWVGFNRKHAAVFGKTFLQALLGTIGNDTRQWLYWQVLSEVLLANQGNSEKWERASDLRTTLGEEAVVPALEGLLASQALLTDKLEGLWKQWDNHNVFGSPTLIGQIRRTLASSSRGGKEVEVEVEVETTATATTEAVKPAVKAPTASTAAAASAETAPVVETSSASPQKKNDTQSTTNKAETTPESNRQNSLSSVGASVGSSGKHRRGSMSSITGPEIEYDFESKNVPLGVVDSREFLDPCTAVATLQIARDVRNDASVQLNSMLVNLPEDIVAKAKSIQNGESKAEDLDEATIKDFSMRMPTKLLELDLEEQCQSIATLQDIVRKQHAAREKLIYLLLKSRCQFGSKPAAKLYLELEATSVKLKQRKQLLVDALELEGMDAELDTTDFDKTLQALAPMAWYQPDDETKEETTSGDADSAKRQRVD